MERAARGRPFPDEGCDRRLFEPFLNFSPEAEVRQYSDHRANQSASRALNGSLVSTSENHRELHPPSRPRLTQTLGRNLALILVFLALTILVTYPQVRGLGTLVPYHADPYFSMWRLAWVAHAIQTDPRTLFEANIFYPAHGTLGYSDAMLLPGTVAAPLFWAGVSPVLIYNLALFAAFALSGYAAFLLARMLTGSVAGSIVAGVIYAFAPYRFCHYMHLELQIVFWIPFALLLIHRIVANGRVRDGVMLGLTVSAQFLSSIYIGIFSLIYVARSDAGPAGLDGVAGMSGASSWRRRLARR